MFGRFAPGRLHLPLLPAMAMAVLLGGCAGAPAPGGGEPSGAAPPPSAPAVSVPQLKRTQPPDSLDTADRYAWQAVVQLGESFAAGDVAGFLSRVSSGFYRGYPALESALRTLVDGSTARSAVVAVSEVAREGERFSVTAEWTTSVTRGGVAEARYGKTVFLFLRSDTSLRLIDYRGSAPFAIEGI